MSADRPSPSDDEKAALATWGRAISLARLANELARVDVNKREQGDAVSLCAALHALEARRAIVREDARLARELADHARSWAHLALADWWRATTHHAWPLGRGLPQPKGKTQ